MKPEDIEFLSKLVNERSGLVLTPDKAYLLDSRLVPVARKGGMKGLEELVAALRAATSEDLASLVTEAMTTNESFFFRDFKPFEIRRDVVLPQLIASRAATKSFRIRCAAASSGQEPYSIAFVLKEAAPKLAGWSHDTFGTDISTAILQKARQGLYSQFEVQCGLPIHLLLKYFEKQDDAWQLNDTIRSMVKFAELNLLKEFSRIGRFDLVFCRNVLIYFDQPTKAQVLERISRILADDGLLFLGGAETVLGVSDKFKPMSGHRGVYCQAGAQHLLAAPEPAVAASS